MLADFTLNVSGVMSLCCTEPTLVAFSINESRGYALRLSMSVSWSTFADGYTVGQIQQR